MRVRILFFGIFFCALSAFSLTVEGNFSSSGTEHPEAISLYCVNSIWAFSPEAGSFPLASCMVEKDGKFELEFSKATREKMLYFLVIKKRIGGFSAGLAGQNYIPLWMDKDSKIRLPEVRLQASFAPMFDTSGVDETNRLLQRVTVKLFTLYVSGMQDTAARFTPQQLYSKKKYANEEARKLLTEKLPLPASVLVYERFEMGEEVMANKEFYTKEVERLSAMMPGHVYVNELKELVEGESKNLKDVSAGMEKDSVSETSYLKIVLPVLLLAIASFFLYRGVKKRRK